MIKMPNHRAKIAGSERIRIKEVNLVARRVAQAHTQIKMVKVHVKLVLLLSIKHQTDSPDVRIVQLESIIQIQEERLAIIVQAASIKIKII